MKNITLLSFKLNLRWWEIDRVAFEKSKYQQNSKIVMSKSWSWWWRKCNFYLYLFNCFFSLLLLFSSRFKFRCLKCRFFFIFFPFHEKWNLTFSLWLYSFFSARALELFYISLSLSTYTHQLWFNCNSFLFIYSAWV